MIERSRDRWYASPECTVVDLINYMTQKGYLRDAQIEAIKTYLFLKIACGNEPLHRLFSNGKFNSLNLDDLEISNKVREYFAENPAAAALYEYSCLTNDADTTQLIPLSAICAYLGKSKCNEPDTIAILSKWYWCGILGEMYGGANETRYANDIEDVIDEVFHRPNPARTVNSAFFSSTRLLTLQTRLSAAYKGIMALLYKEKCRDFMNDTTIDIVNSMLESPDIHHIFPEAYCARQGIKRQRYNSIVNKTPILPATNRSIGGNAPSEYTKAILKKVSGLTEDDLKQRIESHCVNYEMLVADDFDAYFIDRAKKLLSLIEKAMGKPVSDRNAETTIEQFGASLL